MPIAAGGPMMVRRSGHDQSHGGRGPPGLMVIAIIPPWQGLRRASQSRGECGVRFEEISRGAACRLSSSNRRSDLAAWFLQSVIHLRVVGSTMWPPDTRGDGFLMEAVLTLAR